MKIAIMDDDKAFSEKARNMLNCIGEKNNIIINTDIYNNETEFTSHISEYDLIWLDIEMPQINGLELCKIINGQKHGDFPYVIFVSDKDNLVFDALRLFPYSFIRKCDIELDLENYITKLNDKINKSYREYVIRQKACSVKVNTSDIIYLEKQGHYIDYHTKKGNFRERGNISEKESEFIKHGFFKVNQGIIVNPEFAVSLNTGGVLTLQDGTAVPISKAYRETVKEIIEVNLK
ncbi:MAG: LytTR family DNA-binding domain-containing protein [Clostridiales bacterium]|nr:LytTR family DNA-binding domain-containing protein [Clostridiales bacterium]